MTSNIAYLTLNDIEMETIKVKLKQVRVFETAEGIRYRLIFDNKFPAYIVQDNKYVKGECDYITFHPSVLIAQLANINENFATIHLALKENAARANGNSGISAAHVQALCVNQTFILDRAEFKTGEEYIMSNGTKAVHEFDGITTAIKDIEFDQQKSNILENLAMKMLLNM